MTVNPVGPEVPKDQTAERKKFSDKFKQEMRTKTQKADEESKSKQKKPRTQQDEEESTEVAPTPQLAAPGFALENKDTAPGILDVQKPKSRRMLKASEGGGPPLAKPTPAAFLETAASNAFLETPPPSPPPSAPIESKNMAPPPLETPPGETPPPPIPPAPPPPQPIVNPLPLPTEEAVVIPPEEEYYEYPEAPSITATTEQAPSTSEEPQGNTPPAPNRKEEETHTFYKAFAPPTAAEAKETEKEAKIKGVKTPEELKKEKLEAETQTTGIAPVHVAKEMREGEIEKKKSKTEKTESPGMEGAAYTPGAPEGIAAPPLGEGPPKPYLGKEAQKLFTKMVGQISLMKEKAMGGGTDEIQTTRVSLSHSDYAKSIFFNTIIEIKEYATARGQFNVEILCDSEAAEKLAEENMQALIAAFQGPEYLKKNIQITNIRIGRKSHIDEDKKVSRAKKEEDQQNRGG